MNRLLDLGRAQLRLGRLEMRKPLKRRLQWSLLKLFLQHRPGQNRKSVPIAGFNVEYLSYQALCHLYSEIFVDNEYYFVADTERPYIIDCGSNIGMSVIYFKLLYPDCHIKAFEPSEEAFACLKRNVEGNGLLGSVQLRQAALAAREGTSDFYCDPDAPGSLIMSTKRGRLPKQRRTVTATVLSQHIDREVDLLKMDIEGSEQEVMAELAESGKLRYVKQLVMEYHHHVVVERFDRLSEMLSLLERFDFGYQVEGLLGRPLKGGQFQDILIYGYRK